MISARYTQGEGLRFEDIPEPVPGEDDVVLRVAAASLCGTDVKIARHGHRKLAMGQSLTLGHEFVGTVERAGPRVTRVSEGAMVGVAPNVGCGRCPACMRGNPNMCPEYQAFGVTFDGAHTAFVRVPAVALAQGCVIPIPEGVSPLDATLAEPLSCVVNGQRAVKLGLSDTVLIYGAGPIALLHLLLARASGATRVFVVDQGEGRLTRARELGATATLDSTRFSVPQWVREQTGGRGFDVVITATPHPGVQAEAVGLLAPFGRLSLFAGLPGKEAFVALDTNAIHYRALVVTGTTGGAPADYRVALDLIASGRIDVRAVVSHVFPLAGVESAYATALGRMGRKIILAAPEVFAGAGATHADLLAT